MSSLTHLPPFQSVVTQHHHAMFALASAMVGPSRADDVTQEALLSALRAYPDFDGRHPRAWLCQITRRKALDDLRALARRNETELDAAEHLPAVEPPASETFSSEVWEEVRLLPEAQRSVIALRFVADLSHRQIAQVLDRSPAATRQLLSQALSTLRANLTKGDPE